MNFLYDTVNETLNEIFEDTEREGFEDKKEEETGTWGAGLFNRGATEEETKEKKKEEEEKEKENDWKGFFTSMINNFIIIIIFVIISGNILFISENMIHTSFSNKFFPTDPKQSPYNTENIDDFALKFPYFKMDDNCTFINQSLNWFSSALQNSWIYYRTINKFIFTSFSGILKVMGMQSSSKGQDQQILKTIAMGVYFLFSPLIYLFFTIFNPNISFWTTLLASVRSVNINDIGSDSLIYKIISLYPGFILGCIMFILTALHTSYFIFIKPFIVNGKHIQSHIKKFSHLITMLFYILLVISMIRYLSETFLIVGLIVVAVLIIFSLIVYYYF